MKYYGKNNHRNIEKRKFTNGKHLINFITNIIRFFLCYGYWYLSGIFLFVYFIYKEWLFIIVINITGIIIVFLRYKIKDYIRVFIKGQALFLYDILIALILVLIIYVIPHLYNQIRIKFGANTNYVFFTVYPFIDGFVEIIIDYTLSKC